MKILYIANIRIPTEKAHGVQIMKMCEAFANVGNDVELVVPRRFNNIKDNAFEYYNVKRNFKIKKLPTLDLIKFGRIGFWIESFIFSKIVLFYILFSKFDLLYSRDEVPLYFVSFFKKNFLFEVHLARNNFISRRVFEQAKKVIAITQGLKDFYIKNCGVDPSRIVIFPDAVDLGEFQVSLSRDKARETVGLPLNKKIILYAGHLYDWKGASVFAEASKYFNQNMVAVFVGGMDDDLKKFKEKNEKSDKIIIIGRKEHSEIIYWLKSANILVLPNSARNDTSRYYTSPMKLFEYMASGVSIVASDLPSIREILNESNSVLVRPDDAKSLFKGINFLLLNEKISRKLSEQALEDIKKYTWENRAHDILSYI